MKKRDSAILMAIFLLISVQIPPLGNSVQAKSFERMNTQIATSTPLNSPLIESLELLAGKDRAILTQAGFLGGNVTVPFDLDSNEFTHLSTLILAASQQRNWGSYWVGPVWELGDGFTLLLMFNGESYSNAITHSQTIAAQVSASIGQTLQPIFGFQEGTAVTIAYYAAPDDTVLTSYFSSWKGWQNSFYSDGFMPLVKGKLESAPVRVAGDVLAWDPSEGKWLTWSATAFVIPEGITVFQNNTRHISLASENIFNVNQISGSDESLFSHISLKLPYLANVVNIDPETDNLVPEITGRFNWTVRVNVPPYFLDEHYEDIQVVYDLNISSLETFPQIEADYAIDKVELDSGTLNYTLTLTNVGSEEARNIRFAIPLGERPQNFTIPTFNTEVYNFSNELLVYFDWVNGNISQIDPGLAFNLTIQGWFVYINNGSIVQPIVTWYWHPVLEQLVAEIDWESTLEMVHENVTLFIFKHADILTEAEDIRSGEEAEPEFGLSGNIASLAPNESIEVWYAIDSIPGNETVLALDFTVLDNGTDYLTIGLQGATVPFRDWIINDTKINGGDLRNPSHPELLDFLPGLLFLYEDTASRDYFGWSNGLAIQLYDDEAILKTTISTDKVLTRVGESVTVNVTVENLGDSPAANVNVTVHHAFMSANWQFQGVESVYRESLGTIVPGQTASFVFIQRADSFLGIHPLFATVDFITDPNQTTNETTFFNELQYHGITSNLINLFVFPPVFKEGKAEPSFPTPELNVSSEFIMASEAFEVNDSAEVHITVKNLGDELTTIRLKSYFSTAYLSLNTEFYPNRIVKVVRNNQTELVNGTDYNLTYFIDEQLQICQIEISGISLPPNDTIEVYYALRADAGGTIVLPPVEVEYDSSFPIEGISGSQTSTQEEGQVLAQNHRLIHLFQAERLGVMEDNNDKGVHSWSSYSDPLPIEIQLPPLPTSEIPEEVEEAYNVFLGNVSLLASLMLIFTIYLVVVNRKS
ncbi:MAG: hypothetical protein ACFFB3_08455 [Candidatus Hodarchaeota archaeon]